jgi:hypothetical protein
VNLEQFEHFADKYGFPILLVIWMFWRDWYFVKSLALDMKIALNLLEKIANTGQKANGR